jgi:hypothetical protein
LQRNTRFEVQPRLHDAMRTTKGNSHAIGELGARKRLPTTIDDYLQHSASRTTGRELLFILSKSMSCKTWSRSNTCTCAVHLLDAYQLKYSLRIRRLKVDDGFSLCNAEKENAKEAQMTQDMQDLTNVSRLSGKVQ